MAGETVSKAALHKRLTTKPSDARIALILQVLDRGAKPIARAQLRLERGRTDHTPRRG